MTINWRFLAALCLAGWASSPANASCFLCSCSVAADDVAFGTYSPTSSSPRDANATVTVTCYSAVTIFGSADIAISAGGSGNAAARKMTKGTEQLSYNIYRETARTTVWGNGSGGTGTVTVPLNGILWFSSAATAYGRVPAGQWVGPGSYTDTLTVQITF